MDSDGKEDVKEFCVLLFIENGGRVDERGRPVSSISVGYCSDPGDCFSCQLMQKELAQQPPGTAIWVCPACIGEVIKLGQGEGDSLQCSRSFHRGTVPMGRLPLDLLAQSTMRNSSSL
jgi:hypothetical protein